VFDEFLFLRALNFFEPKTARFAAVSGTLAPVFGLSSTAQAAPFAAKTGKTQIFKYRTL